MTLPPQNEPPYETRLARIFASAAIGLADPPPVNWCVEGLLSRPSVTLIVGPPGSKKTILALDLAVCVALGKPWLGMPVVQSPVAYVDEEVGMQRFWKRVNHSLVAHQAARETPFHFVSPGNYDFRDQWDAWDLAGHAVELGARLIVIDALVDVVGNRDETAVASVMPVFLHLRQVAQRAQAAVVVLHHTNRRGFFRGSSSIAAAVDLMLSIESEPSSSLIQVRALKSRDNLPPPFTAQAIFAPDKHWLVEAQSTEEDIELSPTASAVLGVLSSGQATTPGIMEALKSSYSAESVRQTIHRLTVTGHIVRANEGSHGTLASFELAAKPDATPLEKL